MVIYKDLKIILEISVYGKKVLILKQGPWDMFQKILAPQCRQKTFMVHQTFVWWASYSLVELAKSLA